jgi:hypothetical protein
MEKPIQWQMLPTTATPEMANAPFVGLIEPQCCLTQARNRENMASNFAKMVAAAPAQPLDEVAVAARKRDSAEAAELQSWLVGNARNVRPVDQSGLMAWALAALTKVTAERDALQGVARFTSLSKGGEYAVLGTITGAGQAKGLVGRAYRDIASGKLFFREPEDFAKRMQPIASGHDL